MSRYADCLTHHHKHISMQARTDQANVPAIQDPDNERPVPSAWRPTLTSIVDAFVQGDYRLARGIPDVAPVSEETAAQIQEYIDEYGETLVALPRAAWETSTCIWMEDHWDALVDLWTEEEGSSDLVLQVRVAEADGHYLVTVHMVCVP